ncbi:MAG TPA: hypothetical protein VIH90_07925 [Candidatus Saccharimonadales bacterium]
MEHSPEELATLNQDELAQQASEHLDLAERALEYALGTIEWSNTMHPKYFEGCGLSDEQLEQAADFGAALWDSRLDGSKADHRLYKDKVTRKVELVDRFYQSIDHDRFYDPDKVDDYGAIINRAESLPGDRDGLAQVLDLFEETREQTPSLKDVYVVITLGVVTLARGLRRKDIQEQLQANCGNEAFYQNTQPFQQAILLAQAAIKTGSVGTQLIANSLKESLTDPRSKEEVDSFLNDYRLISPVLVDVLSLFDTFHTCTPIVVESVKGGRNYAEALARSEESTSDSLRDDTTEDELLELLNSENELAELTRSLARRSKQIIEQHKSLLENRHPTNESLRLSAFPVSERPIKLLLEALDEQALAQRLEARSAEQLDDKERCIEAIHTLRTAFFPRRSDVKRHPAGNELTSRIYRGEVVSRDFRADPLNSNDAYALVGLMFKISEQLETTDGKKIFDDLFEATENEAGLMVKVKAQVTGPSINEISNWLVNNHTLLAGSDIALFRSIGIELRTYLREANVVVQTQARATRAIEVARMTLGHIDVQSFPTISSSLEALEQDALEIATGPRGNIDDIDWERLLAVDELAQTFSTKGYDTQLYRILPKGLSETAPHYAVTIETNGVKIVISENPKKHSATLVFEESDPQNTSWQEIVHLDTTSAQHFGAKVLPYGGSRNLDDHFQLIIREVEARLTKQQQPVSA